MVQRLVGSLAGEVCGENSRGSQGARRWEVSGSQSYLEQDEKLLSEGATAAEEVEVVGTCVYYYLAGPGHDARSRIGMRFVFSSEALFSNWEQQGVVQCWTGRQEWGHCLECGGVSSL